MPAPSRDVFGVLLERHVPVLRYDSLEPYYADSAAEWTDNPGNELRRSDGLVIATATLTPGAQRLSLGFLGPDHYGDGSAASATDRIADPAHDYVIQAQAMHAQPEYANRVYGHWASGSDGRIWLAYWFFYFYNDYNLVGPLLPAGLHEGDWEMIQLRLDSDGAVPDLAVYAQHRHAEARDWAAVERIGDQPVVYPARGSHASYFEAGTHWTGDWFDHANGRRPGPALTLEVIEDGDPRYGWATWPGLWGGTVPRPGVGEDLHFDDSSPRGPGGHAQWANPVTLLDSVRHPPAGETALAQPPAAPGIAVSRDGANLRINYSTSDLDARALVVAIAPAGQASPPSTFHVTIAAPQGTAEIPAALANASGYAISTVIATADGRSSPATEAELAPAV